MQSSIDAKAIVYISLEEHLFLKFKHEFWKALHYGHLILAQPKDVDSFGLWECKNYMQRKYAIWL